MGSGQAGGWRAAIALSPIVSGLNIRCSYRSPEWVGSLSLITWRLSPADGTITRLADSGEAAGTASHIAVCATNTASGPKYLASMRRGSDNLGLLLSILSATDEYTASSLRATTRTKRTRTSPKLPSAVRPRANPEHDAYYGGDVSWTNTCFDHLRCLIQSRHQHHHRS